MSDDEAGLSARELARLLPLLAPVAAAGAAAITLAFSDLAGAGLRAAQILGLVALVAAAILAEAFPVSIGRDSVGRVSVAAVFIVATAVIYGWAAAALVGLVTSTAVQIWERHGPARAAYNGSVYALAGAGAGALAAVVGADRTIGTLVVAAFVGAAAFWLINVSLVTAAIWRVSRERLWPLMTTTAGLTALPFGIMASTAAMLVALAELSPLLPLTLLGPLVAIALYQRSVRESIVAMRLALTDPLTGLANYRHFNEQLERYLQGSDDSGAPLSLCLFDVDDFKQINDGHGHPAGDEALRRIASALRHGGEAYRLGGDEFALLLPGRSAEEAQSIAWRVMARVRSASFEHGDVALSVGIASYPSRDVAHRQLVAAADEALYAAKGEGKNRVVCFRGWVDGPATPGRQPPPRSLPPERRRRRRTKAA